MSSSPHVMELITRGNIEMYADTMSTHGTSTRHRPAPPTSGHQHDRLQSLETLPPDEPSVMVPVVTTPTSELSSENGADSVTRYEGTSDDAYARIYQLADSMRREVVAMDSSRTSHDQEERSCDVSATSEVQGHPDKDHDGSVRGVAAVTGSSSDTNVEMAVKMKRALAKMRHLDKRLADLSKREKEVKKQRMALEHEDNLLADSRCSSSSDVISHVFATQPPHLTTSCTGDEMVVQCVETTDGGKQTRGNEDNERKESIRGHVNSDDSFIRRNIQLAGDAASIVAMTEQEKARLEQLLTGSEDYDDKEGEGEDSTKECSQEMMVVPAGFNYTEDDLQRIREIDSRLQNMIPAIQWTTPPLHVANSQDTSGDTWCTTTPTTVSDTEGSDEGVATGPGEAVLLQLQVDREAYHRAQLIDTMLNQLQNSSDLNEQNSPPPIDRRRLDELLKQYRAEQSSPVNNAL